MDWMKCHVLKFECHKNISKQSSYGGIKLEFRIVSLLKEMTKYWIMRERYTAGLINCC